MTDAARTGMLDRMRAVAASQVQAEAEISRFFLRVSTVSTEFGQIRSQLGGLSARLSRFDERLSVIERRLVAAEA